MWSSRVCLPPPTGNYFSIFLYFVFVLLVEMFAHVFLRKETKETYKASTEGIKQKNSNRNDAHVWTMFEHVCQRGCWWILHVVISPNFLPYQPPTQTKSGVVRIAVFSFFWWQGKRFIWLAQGAFLTIPVSCTRILWELSVDRSWLMCGRGHMCFIYFYFVLAIW